MIKNGVWVLTLERKETVLVFETEEEALKVLDEILTGNGYKTVLDSGMDPFDAAYETGDRVYWEGFVEFGY